MPSLLDLFNDYYGVRFGSLWWIREELLAERLPTWNRRQDRIGHPAIALATRPARSLDDRIPLAIGTTRWQPGGFRFAVTADGHATHFSFGLVAWVTPRDFLFRDREVLRVLREGNDWDIAKLWRNGSRRALPAEEAAMLRDAWSDWPCLVA